MLRTYKEWQKAGYQVIKGQSSKGRNEDGVALFSNSQVKEAYDPGDDDYEADNIFYDTYIKDMGDR